MKKFLPFLFLLAFTTSISTAQQTGDFYIGFPSPDSLLTEDSVHLYFHVPASYQQGVPSKLIVGIHGLGNPQTPEQIRNYFSPTADSLNTIVVCPKPYITQPVSIDHPRSKLVINIALDSVLQWYSIDTNELFIAGYSAGSDIASRYTLEQPKYRMKGLIWYAPGFFYQPNLSAQIEFPHTCLCFGDADPLSNILGQVTSIRDSFANSPFELFYNEIPGIDHTMEFPNFTREMLECFRFMNDPVNFVPDSSYVGGKIISATALNFHPNPTTGKIIFEGNLFSEVENLQVLDLSGKIIFETVKVKENQEINITGQTPGTYIVRAQVKGENYLGRLVLIEK
ncbi:MAG: T9SS type A sorting domain-containing protein [Chitinophagales bacterium]|nr:T9SS type A sorting domain-containing protein [Chitinophagales bacterium]